MNRRIVIRRLRLVSACLLLLGVLICLSSLPARELTQTEKKAISRCVNKFYEDVNRCTREHPNLPYSDCEKAANAGYTVCIKSAGLSLRQLPPPKAPNTRPVISTGEMGTVSATPAKKRPITDARPTGETKVQAAKGSPTPTSTPTFPRRK